MADRGIPPRLPNAQEHRSQWTCSSSVLLIKTLPPLAIMHSSGTETLPRPAAEECGVQPHDVAAADCRISLWPTAKHRRGRLVLKNAGLSGHVPSSVLLIKTSPPLTTIHGSGAKTLLRPAAEECGVQPHDVAAATQCSRTQVSVDMFLFSAAYQDVATLGHHTW